MSGLGTMMWKKLEVLLGGQPYPTEIIRETFKTATLSNEEVDHFKVT